MDSAEKLGMLRSIGADHVIDYRQEDFTRSGETYDVIIDVIGKSPFSGNVRALKPNGRYILGNVSLSGMIRGRWTSMTSEKKVIVAVASYKTEDYTFLKELIEAGKIKPVIDRRYPLEQTAEAHRYVDTGLKKGNVGTTDEIWLRKPGFWGLWTDVAAFDSTIWQALGGRSVRFVWRVD